METYKIVEETVKNVVASLEIGEFTLKEIISIVNEWVRDMTHSEVKAYLKTIEHPCGNGSTTHLKFSKHYNWNVYIENSTIYVEEIKRTKKIVPTTTNLSEEFIDWATAGEGINCKNDIKILEALKVQMEN